MRKIHKIKLGELFYVMPAIAVIAFVMLLPLCYTLFISFFKVDINIGDSTFIGIRNFIALFNDKIFLLAIKNTLLWTVGSVILQFLIGFTIANILNMDSIKGKTGIRIILMVPWVLPSVVSALVWQWMYHSDFGIINEVLKQIGIITQSISWTSSKDTALLSAIIINVWKMVPFVILMTEAALQNVPNELKEAARIDGANTLMVFRYVTLPSISSTINTIILLLMVWTMNAFTFIYILTEGGPAHQTEILSLYIYRTYFKGYKMGRASAAATVLFILTAVAALLYNKYIIGRGEEE